MKLKCSLLVLALLSQTASAEVDWKQLAQDKADNRKEMDALSCAEVKEGLAAAAEGVPLIRSLKTDTNDYEIVLFNLELMLRKGASCIP